MNTIDDVIKSEYPKIAELGNKAAKYKQQYEQKLITAEEYKELLTDLTRIEVVKEEMEDVEYMRDLKRAFDLFMVFKSLAPMI